MNKELENLIRFKGKNIDYNDIEQLLSSMDNNEVDKSAQTIALFKKEKLNSHDIMSLFEFCQDPNKISKAIIMGKKSKLTPNDILYIIHYDKDYNSIKKLLYFFFPKDYIDEMVDKYIKLQQPSEWRDYYIKESVLRKLIRKILHESFI